MIEFFKMIVNIFLLIGDESEFIGKIFGRSSNMV